MSNTVISYPIPAYSNLPIEAQYYQPSRFVISAISLGVSTTITTSNSMNYVVGQSIRLIIPPSFGSRQLNERQGYITSILSPTQVVVAIDSSQNVDPFILASSSTYAQILAIGDVNTGVINDMGNVVTGTNIPGSFINISPS